MIVIFPLAGWHQPRRSFIAFNYKDAASFIYCSAVGQTQTNRLVFLNWIISAADLSLLSQLIKFVIDFWWQCMEMS